MKVDVKELKNWIVEKEVNGYIGYCEEDDWQYNMIIESMKELVRRIENEPRKNI